MKNRAAISPQKLYPRCHQCPEEEEIGFHAEESSLIAQEPAPQKNRALCHFLNRNRIHPNHWRIDIETAERCTSASAIGWCDTLPM